MTDVAGPPAPPERFSSSPIRGADAATGGSTDGSDLDVNCSMAPVFEIPTENRTKAGRQAEIPQAGSQIVVPFSAPILPAGSITGIWVGGRLTASTQISAGCDSRPAR